MLLTSSSVVGVRNEAEDVVMQIWASEGTNGFGAVDTIDSS